MKFVLFLICQFSLFVTSAQNILEDKYIPDVKGPVKEYSEVSFKYAYEGGDTTYKERSIKRFDKNGRLIELQEKGPYDEKYNKTVFTYNDSGYLQEIREFQDNGRYNSHYAYEYDKNGNIIKETRYYFLYDNRPTEIMLFTYDKNNRLTEIVKRWGFPKINSLWKAGEEFDKERKEHSVYQYDEKGFAIGRRIVRTGLEDLDWPALNGGVFEYKNDTTGRRLFTYRINKDNTKKAIEEFKYNKNGSLQEHKQAGFRYLYEYVYDQNGNWIKRIQRETEPNHDWIGTHTIRKITYY